MGLLKKANQSFKEKNYLEAVKLYNYALKEMPSLKRQIEFNIRLAKRKAEALQESQYERSGEYSAFEEECKKTVIPEVVGEGGKSNGIFYKKCEFLKSSRGYDDKVKIALTKADNRLSAVASKKENRILPLVSVIMPTYNRAKIISESIQSVLEQVYDNFEIIICDDGSRDSTEEVVKKFNSSKVKYVKQENQGAAAARNTALRHARGEIITYLDTDNYWHPAYLASVVSALEEKKGHSSVYCDFIDFRIDKNNAVHIKSVKRPKYSHEDLIKKPFIDLNTFAHRRELYDLFGGFDQTLTRRQDYDLILKFTWLRDPIHIEVPLALYQRNDFLEQITKTQKHDNSCIPVINRKIERYFDNGLPVGRKLPIKKVTVIVWDICRNHFSKPFSVAEALSRKYDVELVSFDFFDEGMFSPLKDVNPNFEQKYFKGSDYPSFHEAMDAAIEAVTGDIMYVVKPRLPSFGLAMLVNAKKRIPFVLEINDLETVVTSPKASDKHKTASFSTVDLEDKELSNPYSNLWSNLLDPLVKEAPVLVTHNKGLDAHYNWQTLYMRNLKDETVYHPGKYDRNRVREELGFGKDDRVILFGGLLRKHKGIYELVDLVERLQDSRYKLLFVGSRPTPDQAKLIDEFKETITVLPPQDRESMARINYAADLVILWLNPDVPASHYQFPYKATDAFAMRTPVIANDISDLGDLGRQGYLRLVPFGDWDAMVKAISLLFSDIESTQEMCDAARRLYLRQFSFNAAVTNFELAAYRAIPHSYEAYPVSEYFAKQYEKVYKRPGYSGSGDGRSLKLIHTELPICTNDFGVLEVDSSIFILDVDSEQAILSIPSADVAVLVYASTAEDGMAAARLFVKRANYTITVCIVVGGEKEESKKLVKALGRISAKYVVISNQHAFPCRDWLEFAYKAYQSLGKKEEKVIYAATGGKPIKGYHHCFTNSAKARVLLDKKEKLTTSRQPTPAFLIADLSEANERNDFTSGIQVQLVDVKSLDDNQVRFHQEVCVIMPCVDQIKGLKTANLLQRKAGMSADFVVAKDTKRQGFIKTLNQAARCSQAKYIVYLAEDAIPGDDWLTIAYQALEEKGKSLLAFNCGKWHGRVAAFGMLKKSWVYGFYDQCILFDGYQSHRADNEITVIARAQDQYVYSASAVLFENDQKKDFKVVESDAKNFSRKDKNLFKRRFKGKFGGVIDEKSKKVFFDEYLNQSSLVKERLNIHADR